MSPQTDQPDQTKKKKKPKAALITRRHRVIGASRARTAFTDGLAVSLCLLGAAAFFYLFWADLNKSLTKANEKPIANVYIKKNTAQRRFGDRVVWDILQKDSPVYQADVIHTADASEATVLYIGEDGSEEGGFDLAENSLIQVFDDRIELANGQITIRTFSGRGRRLKLVSAGTVIDIGENATISANSLTAGGGNIQVLEGSAKITTKDGEQFASAGQAVGVSADGIRKNVPQIVPLLPRPNQSIIGTPGSEEHPVRFQWQTSNFRSDDITHFEVASDQRFRKIVNTEDIRGESERTVSLAPGSYWWRVYPVSGATDADSIVMVNKLTVLSVAPPKLIQPADASTVRYFSEPPSVRFLWGNANGSGETGGEENFRIEVADNMSMAGARINATARGQNYFVTTELSPGHWYWRVRPVFNADVEGGSAVQAVSAVYSFTLEKSDSQLGVPVLQSPADGAQVSLAGLMLSWRAEAAAEIYMIQVAQNDQFTAPDLSRGIPANFFNVAQEGGDLRDGVYYWRVQARDGAGNISAWSQARSFTFSREPPPVEAVLPRDGWTTGETNFTASNFSWKFLNDGIRAATTQVRLQISSSQNFSPLQTDLPATGTETKVPVLPGAGNFFWRLLWTARDGRTYATSARRLVILAPNRIVLESPPDGASFDALTLLRSPPTLRWSSAESVNSSRLRLVSGSMDGETILDITDPGRSVALPTLREGTYFWTVRGEGQGGTDISAPQAFSFRIGPSPLLPAVTLTAPSSGSTINDKDLRESRTLRFAWSASSSGNGYILTIYKDADRSRVNPVWRSSVLRRTEFIFDELNLLDSGRFIWSVEPLFVNAAGGIEQHGSVRESNFRINIDFPAPAPLRDEQTWGIAE